MLFTTFGRTVSTRVEGCFLRMSQVDHAAATMRPADPRPEGEGLDASDRAPLERTFEALTSLAVHEA